ncbi:unnamed protein product [Parnassius apollo]|uniref:(apollo) hypothetical protein n=1 Tax=Parnassius apollo TaxID=110799 RepID=A0A8S3XZ36_PARAO|nr:unnamed protein product [Parnassius apollo]
MNATTVDYEDYGDYYNSVPETIIGEIGDLTDNEIKFLDVAKEFQEVIKHFENIIKLIIPFFTLCFSIKAFLNISLSRNVYTAKELSVFCYCSAAIIHLYEELLIYVLGVATIYEDCPGLSALQTLVQYHGAVATRKC